MHKLYVFALVLSILFVTFFNVQPLHSLDRSLVFSQIQTRSLSGGTASEELIEIYNNSDIDVDVTNWCVIYGSTGSLDPVTGQLAPSKTLVRFEHSVPNVGNYVIIPKRSSILLISNAFADKDPKFGYDYIFSSGISDSERWLSILNNSGELVDTVEWGTNGVSTTAEGGQAAPAPTATQLIQRKMIMSGDLQDTDNNFNDFELAPSRGIYNPGSVLEVEDYCLNIDGIQSIVPDGYTTDDNRNCNSPPVDVCENLDGLQIVVPSGYELIDYQCQIDVCLNIDGMQLTVPTGYDVDDVGDCEPIPIDVCDNLDGLQIVIPDSFKYSDENDCVLDLLPLKLSEILPNAVGNDVGNEYIEIYNPNDTDVDLLYYFLYIDSDYEHSYSFPAGSVVKAGQYMAFYNSEIKFTLLNTSGSVRLQPIDSSFIDETAIYHNPAEGESWALIDGKWQYTNQSTPNESNLESIIKPEIKSEIKPETKPIVVTKSTLQPCASNQYRSPETNRCRLITTISSSTLVPCKNGQYRSEETGRCRNIATDANVLTPCAEGQERNPATNRCRSIETAVLGASDLVPCKTGQERNPETNRCRNVVSSVPTAAYAPEQTYEASNSYVLWWSLAGVGFVAVVYGVWEWRQEIVKLANRIGPFRHLNK